MNHAGEQSAQVYNARVGMVLHIQNLEGQERWQGVKFVPVDEAKYTENLTKRGYGSIGIKNDVGFDIFVSVLSTEGAGFIDTRQFLVKPNTTSYWNRWCPESVFVAVAVPPGWLKHMWGVRGLSCISRTGDRMEDIESSIYRRDCWQFVWRGNLSQMFAVRWVNIGLDSACLHEEGMLGK
ncbi:hypothetical protein FA13DRAFT_1769408 [Coprinellus micaceus]|uniref:Uncharacterized protein n=1 Tax=Coprinellus micaceus TaxID=71717 RepID=A0A4Y7U132_COPMI|nr:hypothetical protein FA13DRAFT_1769408 [Coprinellus micaceus]